jgi:hypothetical protein
MSHNLRGNGTRIWTDELVDKTLRSANPETGIRRIVANKNKVKLQKIGLYLSKYEEKWRRLVKKHRDETVTN